MVQNTIEEQERMSDAELIEQFRQGDVGAFNRLVRRWEQPLYNFILRYAGSREEAKDLCQLAFIRAYHHLKRLKDPQKFSSWIYQIVLNVCRDEQRKHRRRQTFSLNHGHDTEVSAIQPDVKMEKHPRTDPELAAQNRDLRELLDRMDNALAPEYRHFFRSRARTLGTYKNGLGAVFFLNSDESPATREGEMFRVIERLEKTHDLPGHDGNIARWGQDLQDGEMQALQTALLEVVGNYSHTLRPLPESESVVIAVDIDRQSPQDGRHGGFILQVNKKDLDTYNRGQMGIQEFRKRAIIRRY